MKQNELRFTRLILMGSLMCNIVILLVLAISRTRLIIVLLGLIVFTVFIWFLVPYLHRRGKPIGWLISIAVINFLIIFPELTLRATNFEYESKIEFDHPWASPSIYYEPDQKLFWKLRPEDDGVNSLGFPGDEIEIPKPQNTFRILFLGDSVTQIGHYPELVEQLLELKESDRIDNIESTVLAVAGYSSHQGRILAETYGSLVEPDLVVVYFGWNDHWLAYGSTDADKIVPQRTRLGNIGSIAYRNIRILQGMSWALNFFKGTDRPIGKVRVPADQYRDNLKIIQNSFPNNVPIILITAPTTYYNLGVPGYLVEKGYLPDSQSAIDFHKLYNEIVREVGQGSNSLVLDLENEFKLISDENLQTMFWNDGIHLTEIGQAIVTNRISEFIYSNVLSKSQ